MGWAITCTQQISLSELLGCSTTQAAACVFVWSPLHALTHRHSKARCVCVSVRRLDGTKITVLLVHPGIVPTSLSRWYGPLSLIYAGLAAGWTKTVQQVCARL